VKICKNGLAWLAGDSTTRPFPICQDFLEAFLFKLCVLQNSFFFLFYCIPNWLTVATFLLAVFGHL